MNASIHIKAMIFAAGLGTRLKPWTDSHPKALAVVAGKSLLQRNMEYLAGHGITDVVVNVHHFPDQIIDAIQQNAGWGSFVTVSDERDEVLETGGGLLKAASLFRDAGLILTMNADILTDLDLDAMTAAHVKSGFLITLAVTERSGSRKLLFDEEMSLCGWRNQSTGEERIVKDKPALREFSFSGITLMRPDVIPMINQRGKFSLIDVFLDLAANNKLAGFNHSGGLFMDVGKPESLEKAAAVFGS